MKRRLGICAITIVIAGLLISGAANSVAQVSDEDSKLLDIKKVDGEMISVQIDEYTKLETTYYEPSYSPLATMIVTGATHNTVASEGATIVAGFRTTDEPENIYFTHSTDSGANFGPDASGWSLDFPPSYPEVDNTGDGRYIGTMLPHEDDHEGGAMYKVSISDPTVHPTGYNAVSWDFSSLGQQDEHHMTDFYAVDCGGYVDDDPVINDWAYGGHSFVCDYYNDLTGTNYDGLPVHTYQYSEPGAAWIHWYPSQQGSTYISVDIDPETLYAYNVCNPDGDLFWFIFKYDDWNAQDQHPSGSNGVINTVGNDTLFDVSALDSNVIIVTEREGDIYAIYSSNAMSSHSEILLASDGTNPRVVHTDEDEAMCTFIKDGQVYITETDDGGSSWSPIEAIDEVENDNVAEQRGAADVCAVGASWWSTIDDTVYFALAGTPPPVLEITKIKGGIGAKATIKNTAVPGAADATNVSATMKVTGGVLGLINKNRQKKQAVLASEGEFKIGSGLILGAGRITVEVSVTCDQGSSDSAEAKGWQFIIVSLL